ncbi:MAG: OprO/OprP family phosphate-selective porin, partial [Gammaproteobacteria bacterium]
VEDIARAGAEAALVWGPFSLQGEYIWTHLDRDSGLSDPAFDGYYVYGSWFLTGESRPYDNEKGRFTGVLPKSIVGKGGYGAWEVALRYSDVDLNDEDIEGGEEDNLTVGLNWYPTRNIRFMANYIHANSERQRVEDDPHVFQIRTQFILE